MGFPCHHVACVLRREPNFAQLHPEGFPLFSISAMWHTAYYLYGISNEKEHKHIHETYIQLRDQDTTGVHIPDHISIPEQGTTLHGNKGSVSDLLAVECVCNYDTVHVCKCFQNVVSTAPNLGFSSLVPPDMTQQSNANHSQESYSDDFFTLQDGPSYTNRVMQDMEDNHALDNQDVFSRCKAYYRDTSNVINGLDGEHKEQMVQKLIDALNGLYYKGMRWSREERGDQSGDMEGQKFAMLPPVSKKRKTHGTKHYS